MSTTLVLGASGFLGSHLAKQLAADGRKLRVFTRPSSDLGAIDHLDFEHVTGDIHDQASLQTAMQGCDTVFNCIVDTRSWLLDSAPLYRTNVDGARSILEAALASDVGRLVFVSSIVTIGLDDSGIANEETEFNWWDCAPEYVKTRVLAEQLVQEFVAKGLDAVVCNVATTYGEADVQPTPHGTLAKLLALGKMPVYWKSKLNLVGIKDAARGLMLAEQRGRTGERYLISDRLMTMEQFCFMVADLAGQPRPRVKIPYWLMHAACVANQTVMHALGKDTEVTVESLELSNRMADFDNGKARRELGWEPRPLEESLEEAVTWFQQNPTRT